MITVAWALYHGVERLMLRLHDRREPGPVAWASTHPLILEGTTILDCGTCAPRSGLYFTFNMHNMKTTRRTRQGRSASGLGVMTRVSALLATLVGCGTVVIAASPMARKWVGPPVSVPGGGQFRTVIYYGPWQCSSQFMQSCQNKCAGSGHVLQGCMWIADIKMDFEGTVARAGSRFGLTHCCCNYSEISVQANDASRRRWDAIRTDFREEWAKRFGAWPSDPDGRFWQAHHIHDLKHGGHPTEWDNILPMPQDVHESLKRTYAQCYANSGPWTSVGVDHPYGE